MSFIADDLIFNLLDTVFAGLVVIDKVATNPSVIFYLGLAKGVNTGGSVPRCVEGLWPGRGFLVAVDDVLVAGSDQV